MRPWKVGVGLTVTVVAVASVLLWTELEYLRPYLRWVVREYWWPWLFGYGASAVGTLVAGFYCLARVVGLGDVGRRVEVMERSVRRGDGYEPDLAAALDRDAAGEFGE